MLQVDDDDLLSVDNALLTIPLTGLLIVLRCVVNSYVQLRSSELVLKLADFSLRFSRRSHFTLLHSVLFWRDGRSEDPEICFVFLCFFSGRDRGVGRYSPPE